VLDVPLVVVTHYDIDKVGGIPLLLEELADARRAGREPLARIGSIWYNHFLPIEGRNDRRAGESIKDLVPRLAAELGIGVNVPFDYFAMPSERGPARVTLDRRLAVTVIAPDARWLRGFYDAWRSQQTKRGLDGGTDLARETGLSSEGLDSLDDAVATLAEGFSSPQIELLRAPPRILQIPPPDRPDRAPVNLSSIVTLFEVDGRRALFCGDGRCDHIVKGLSQAGLLLTDDRLHLDVLQLPHWGSARNVSPLFFKHITADHYVITSDHRFRLPALEPPDMIAQARGDEPYVVHLPALESLPWLAGAPLLERMKDHLEWHSGTCYTISLDT
jgi:hypothetical protein